MNEQAAHLVDRVLPKTPYRQFVLTLPGELARIVAFDTALATAVFGAFADEVARWQSAVARAQGIERPEAEAGCVLEIQRFADGARLFPHAHALVPEGVFYEAPDRPATDAHGESRGESSRSSVRFHRLRPPTDADIQTLVLAIEQRMKRVLGRWRAAGAGAGLKNVALLVQCAEVSPNEVTRIQGQQAPEPKRAKRPDKPLCARSPGGLELHADVFIAAHDRAALERICRYMARPPIPQDRLSWRADGKLVMDLKRTWKGGVRAVVFEPLALIARLAALVPTPYMHLRRFYGIFAPNHGWRVQIVPTPPDPASATAHVAPKRPKSMPWADLLMPRSCAPETRFVDALRCPYCGGRMRVICAIGDPDAITAILAAVDAHERTDGAHDPPPRAMQHHAHAV